MTEVIALLEAAKTATAGDGGDVALRAEIAASS